MSMSVFANHSAQIRSFQQEVHRSIATVGGYWSPLSGLARLLEELGELAEVWDGQNSIDTRALCEELSDVFIISTCLANQYGANLTADYAAVYKARIALQDHLQERSDLKEQQLGALINLGGQIARIVNHYDGDKPRKKTEVCLTLSCAIAQLHYALLNVAAVGGIDLMMAAKNVLSKSAIRDRGRFLERWDPSMAPSIKRFLQSDSVENAAMFSDYKCWGSPDHDPQLTVAENVEAWRPSFERYCRIHTLENLSGYIIEIIADEDNAQCARSKSQIYLRSLINESFEIRLLECMGITEPHRTTQENIGRYASVFLSGHPTPLPGAFPTKYVSYIVIMQVGGL
jgi:NTP pyrophosphatase (non-canonical NTP hydrolase)